MQLQDYMRAREEFSALSQRLKDTRNAMKQAFESLSWDPFSFSFTRNGNLLVDHAVQTSHIKFPEATLWPSVESLTDLVNSLHAKKVEMNDLYQGLPEDMRKVVQSPNDLLKAAREEGRR